MKKKNVFNSTDYGGCYASNASKKSSKKQNENHNSANDSPSKQQYVQPMSFKKLSYILDQTPLNIFLDVIQMDSGFLEILNRSSNSTEMILSTLKVILKFMETPFTEHIQIFLNEIRGKINYWKQIETMLKETTTKAQPVQNAKQKKKNNKVILHRNELELWQQTYALSSTFIKYMDLPLGFVKNILQIIKANKNENLNLSQFESSFEQLLHDLKADDPTDEYETYYRMNIHPTIDELKEKQKNYVTPNIVKGRFDNVEHYLNTQLALLREDFIGPLRDGICQLMKAAAADPTAKLKSNLNIRVYENVRILIKQRENAGFHTPQKNEYLMVDLEAANRAENEPLSTGKYSKKLMYGSLLCFTTSTTFDDLIIAVVSNRDVDLLGEGFVCIFIFLQISINYHFIFFLNFNF